MRKIVAAVAVVGLLAAASLAWAGQVTTTQTLRAVVVPNLAGSNPIAPALVGTNYLGVLTATSNSDGSQPPVVQRAIIVFPRGFVFNGRFFPRCPAAVLNSRGKEACPRGSQVGRGNATAVAANGAITASPTVTAFNSGPNSIELFLELEDPISIQQSLTGVLRYIAGYPVLIVDIPDQVRHPVPGVDSSLTRFVTVVGARTLVRARGRTYVVNYLTTLAGSCPRSGRWTFLGFFFREDGGPTLRDTAQVPCRAPGGM